jgi:hypothetical protein
LGRRGEHLEIEGFYVLAGLPTFQVGADLVTGGPGTWVFAPRG